MSLLGVYQSVGQTAFENKLKDVGIIVDQVKDWSDSATVTLPRPQCAYVNIPGITSFSSLKNTPVWVELYDGNGNYFRKRAIIGIQGKSSTKYKKKNIKMDFCNDEWIGEDTPDITFGNWVEQDGFHLKAFYMDYFRGTGIVGYHVYDLLTSGRGEYGRIWERASLKKPDIRALGHPDAFPCVVYLDGEFWGLYAWQLKKNRKNMNMKKNTPEHIHLDGNISYNNVYGGTLKWQNFYIKTPKTLYDMNGKVYDDDNSKELMDETSPYYHLDTDDDKTRGYKENSAIVKKYIQQLSHYYAEIQQVISSKAGTEAIRAAIDERFDVASFIDYIIHNLLTNNLDGLQRNYQLVTYDGRKWFISPYDLDATFGYTPVTWIVLPPKNYGLGLLTKRTFSSITPFNLFEKYFKQDIYDRYAYLRDNGFLSAETVTSLFEDWYYSFGERNYQAEYEFWNLCPVNLETICNEPWKQVDFDRYDYSDFTRTPTYKDTVTYQAGQWCKMEYRLWETSEEVTGVTPYQRIGDKDSIGRIHPWVTAHLGYLDQWMKYSFTSLPKSYSLTISSTGWSTLCVPFSFAVPDNVELYTVKGRNENGGLIKERVDYPQANQPYLVKGEPGIYVLSGYSEDSGDMQDDYLVNGCLNGCYAERYVPKGKFVLQNHDGKVAFYQVGEDGMVKIGPNKAYLSFGEDAMEVNNAVVTIDDAVTRNIMISENGQSITGTYNLGGQKTDRPKKGVYVITYSDGKKAKVVIK